MTVHRLTRRQARRMAVQAQLLDRPRPTDLHEVVHHLTLLQNDPASPVARSADLVLWSRLGSSYQPAELAEALEGHALLELRGLVRPAEDLALYRADMADWPGRGEVKQWRRDIADWVAANDECRREILEALRGDGPLPAGELRDTCAVPWRSSGWTNQRNVLRLLDFLVQRGEVAVSGHAGPGGRDKLWDLAERVYPDDPVVPAEEARRRRNERRLAALGIARVVSTEAPVEALDVGDVGEPAVVEGVKGSWRVDPSLLGRPFAGRAALLSPLDRLVYDRKRMAEIFEFDYQLEMFKPAATRRWGYWALPILYGDRLVGKLDATADHDQLALRVDAVHEDVPFSAALARAVRSEMLDLARWLRLDLLMPGGERVTPRGRRRPQASARRGA